MTGRAVGRCAERLPADRSMEPGDRQLARSAYGRNRSWVLRQNTPATRWNLRRSNSILLLALHVGVNAAEKAAHLLHRSQRNEKDHAVIFKDFEPLPRAQLHLLANILRNHYL